MARGRGLRAGMKQQVDMAFVAAVALFVPYGLGLDKM
jgi:hypothetical protein